MLEAISGHLRGKDFEDQSTSEITRALKNPRDVNTYTIALATFVLNSDKLCKNIAGRRQETEGALKKELKRMRAKGEKQN